MLPLTSIMVTISPLTTPDKYDTDLVGLGEIKSDLLGLVTGMWLGWIKPCLLIVNDDWPTML